MSITITIDGINKSRKPILERTHNASMQNQRRGEEHRRYKHTHSHFLPRAEFQLSNGEKKKPNDAL
jgi:hypothetical protein